MRKVLRIKADQQFISIAYGNTIQRVPKRKLEEVRGIMAGADQTSIRDRSDRSYLERPFSTSIP